MANRTNLIATYNANPTLQSRYTLQQYLDLFGLGQTTTPTPDPDPTPTPTPEQPGIPNIINQNLNQGGGGDGGPPTITEPRQYFEKTYTGATFPDGTPIMSGFEETEGPGFLDSLGNAISGLASFAETYSPVNMIGKAIQERKNFQQAQTNKAIEQAAIQEQIRQAEAQAAAAAAEAAALANATTYRYNDPSQRIDPTERADRTSDAFRAGGADVPSATYTDTGREGFAYGLADGGRVYLYNRLK